MKAEAGVTACRKEIVEQFNRFFTGMFPVGYIEQVTGHNVIDYPLFRFQE